MSDDIDNDIFEYNDKFYIIKPTKFETRERFMERVWYILNRINKLEDTFDNLIKLSILWSNVKNLKCVYNDDIMKKLDLSSRV
jgi:hypothetical protein